MFSTQYIVSDLFNAWQEGIIDTDEYQTFLGYYYEMVAASYTE